MSKKKLTVENLNKVITRLSSVNDDISEIFSEIINSPTEYIPNDSEIYIDLGNFEKHEYKKILIALDNLRRVVILKKIKYLK
jgi:hypothetical protein